MRRKMQYVPHPRRRAFIYACSIFALAVYAVPRLPQLAPGIQGTFSTVWILFAVLAMAANLYFLFGADKERSRMLELQEAEAAKPAQNQMAGRVRRQAQ